MKQKNSPKDTFLWPSEWLFVVFLYSIGLFFYSFACTYLILIYLVFRA